MKHTTKEEAKLLDVLSEIYPDSAKRTLRQMLTAKRVSVDGQLVTKSNALLTMGQKVTVGKLVRKAASNIDLLYEDSDMIVINKPEGLLSVPLDEGTDINVVDQLRAHFRTAQIYPVHRIDKGTSGVIAFARGKRCTSQLTQMFRRHDLQREYLAIVRGYVKKNSGTWESRLVERNNLNTCRTENPKEGRVSITHFTVLKRSRNFSYLRFQLKTGRKHQIRVQSKDAGHPIVGDKRYGEKGCDPISRMALHASSLSFIHPHTGKPMQFSAPLPWSFVRLGFPRPNN